MTTCKGENYSTSKELRPTIHDWIYSLENNNVRNEILQNHTNTRQNKDRWCLKNNWCRHIRFYIYIYILIFEPSILFPTVLELSFDSCGMKCNQISSFLGGYTGVTYEIFSALSVNSWYDIHLVKIHGLILWIPHLDESLGFQTVNEYYHYDFYNYLRFKLLAKISCREYITPDSIFFSVRKNFLARPYHC